LSYKAAQLNPILPVGSEILREIVKLLPEKTTEYLVFRQVSESAHEIEHLLFEFLKFLVVQLKIPDLKIMIGEQIDQVWHALVLETKIYSDVCGFVQPGAFLHHRSSFFEDNDFEETNESLQKHALEFALNYRNLFGEITKESIKSFPQLEILATKWATDLQDLNFRLFRILEEN